MDENKATNGLARRRRSVRASGPYGPDWRRRPPASPRPTFRAERALRRFPRPRSSPLRKPLRAPPVRWEWYDWRRASRRRRSQCGNRLAGGKRLPDFTLITQNVGGLHAKPGKEILALHATSGRCDAPGAEGHRQFRIASQGNPAALPGLLRPFSAHIVWSGRPSTPAMLRRAFRRARGRTSCSSSGRRTSFEPAASLPFARRRPAQGSSKSSRADALTP